MNKHKKLLEQFSYYPITIEDIKKNGSDINSKEFIISFQWLESEKFIRPLSGSTCGLRIGAAGIPGWVAIDLVVTQKGKDYLHPIRSFLPKPIIIEICKYIILVILGTIIGVYVPDIKQLLSPHQDNTPKQIQTK